MNRKQVKGVREVGFTVLNTRSIFPLSPDYQPILPPIETGNKESTKSTFKQHFLTLT